MGFSERQEGRGQKNICPHPGCGAEIFTGAICCQNCGGSIDSSGSTGRDEKQAIPHSQASGMSAGKVPSAKLEEVGYAKVTQDVHDHSSQDHTNIDTSSKDTIITDKSYTHKHKDDHSQRTYRNEDRRIGDRVDEGATQVKDGGINAGGSVSQSFHGAKSEHMVLVSVIAIVVVAAVAIVFILQKGSTEKISQQVIQDVQQPAKKEEAENLSRQLPSASSQRSPEKPQTASISDSVHSTAVESVGLTLSFVYRPGGTGQFRSLQNGDAMSSGDHYKLFFRPDRDAHVYIYQLDSSGNIFRLFPMIRFGNQVLNNINPVQKGQFYVLPANDKSFSLDRNTGKERIYVFVSDNAKKDLEFLDQKLSEAQSSKNTGLIGKAEGELGKYLRARGLADVVEDRQVSLKWDSKSDAFQAMGKYIKSSGENEIHLVEFNHK